MSTMTEPKHAVPVVWRDGTRETWTAVTGIPSPRGPMWNLELPDHLASAHPAEWLIDWPAIKGSMPAGIRVFSSKR